MIPNNDKPGPLDPRMRTILAAVAVTGGVLTLGAAAFGGPGVAFSVLVGAGLALGNLWALARIVVAFLPPGAGPRQRTGPDESAEARAGQGRRRAAGLGGWAVLGVLKMVGLMAAVWLLMRHEVVSPLPMVVGFGALPIGIAIGSLVSDRGTD
jgi:hypothetical protein